MPSFGISSLYNTESQPTTTVRAKPTSAQCCTISDDEHDPRYAIILCTCTQNVVIQAVMVLIAVDRLGQGVQIALAIPVIASVEGPGQENATLVCFPLLRILTRCHTWGIIQHLLYRTKIYHSGLSRFVAWFC